MAVSELQFQLEGHLQSRAGGVQIEKEWLNARTAVLPLVIVSGSQENRYKGSGGVLRVRPWRWWWCWCLRGPAEEAASGSQSEDGDSKSLPLSQHSTQNTLSRCAGIFFFLYTFAWAELSEIPQKKKKIQLQYGFHLSSRGLLLKSNSSFTHPSLPSPPHSSSLISTCLFFFAFFFLYFSAVFAPKSLQRWATS